MVLHWMSRIKGRFHGVERFGGPGDMGRDVICWESKDKCLGIWHNIQCKRYGRVLAPSDLWPEIGKVFWHASNGDYALPHSMRFLCSNGIGTSAKHLLTNPTLLKQGLIDRWDKNVRNNISTQEVDFDGVLKELIEKTHFGIFGPLSIEETLRDLEGTAYYVTTFGGGLPSRPTSEQPPVSLNPTEARYTTQLFAVYAERRGAASVDLASLDKEPAERRHFDRCRVQFYCAESLREFARDPTQPGTFEGIQEDVLQTVTPDLDGTYANSFERVNNVLKTAALMPAASNALYSVMDVADKQGICHQLVNGNIFDWALK